MYSYNRNLNLNKENSKEENNIYKLVDLISTVEKKISQLYKSMEHNKKNDLYHKLSTIDEKILNSKNIINNYIKEKKKREINNNSEILLFHNSSLSEDENLLKIYEINEEIPIFNEKDKDKIVTDEKHYVECENNRKNRKKR